MPVVAPSTSAKYLWAAGGAGLGALASREISDRFITSDQAKKLDEAGISTIDASQMRTGIVATTFGLAAGIALGLAKRGDTTGFTTATHISMGALLGTVADAAINSDRDPEDYLQGIGVMGVAVGAGSLMGVHGDFAHLPLRGASLGLFGLAAGLLAPSMIAATRSIPEETARGMAYKNVEHIGSTDGPAPRSSRPGGSAATALRAPTAG